MVVNAMLIQSINAWSTNFAQRNLILSQNSLTKTLLMTWESKNVACERWWWHSRCTILHDQQRHISNIAVTDWTPPLEKQLNEQQTGYDYPEWNLGVGCTNGAMPSQVRLFCSTKCISEWVVFFYMPISSISGSHTVVCLYALQSVEAWKCAHSRDATLFFWRCALHALHSNNN